MTSFLSENNTELNPLMYEYVKEDECSLLIWVSDPFQKNGRYPVPVLNVQLLNVHVARVDKHVASFASARVWEMGMVIVKIQLVSSS